MGAAYQTRLEAVEVSKATGDLYLILTANLKLAGILRMQGQLQRVLMICQQQLRLAENSGLSQMIVVGWLLAMWGEVLAEINDLDGAILKAKKGVELTEHSKDVAMLGWSTLCLMRVLFSRGDFAHAEETIQKVEHTAREYDVPPSITNPMTAWQVRIWLAQGKLDDASQWMGERQLDFDGDLTYLNEMEYIALTRILIDQGRLDESTKLLERLLQAAEAGGRTLRLIEILMLMAIAFQAKGDTNQAMVSLERALTLAEPEGFIRIFVDEGQSMAHLLYKALSRKIKPDYVRRLLAAFPLVEPELADPSKSQVPESELAESLSERELEVLQLIAEGLTNQEIATRLFISLNTVKVHTRNINGKLAVSSRAKAVARAKALGILPSI
jgi:LuxR family maltose regulon positive regulatory protein